MDEQPNKLERASRRMRLARGAHAAALGRKKLSPNDPAAAERLQDATGAAREAWGDYREAADTALAPIKATIDDVGARRLEESVSVRDSSHLDPLTAYADNPAQDDIHHPYTAYNQGYDAGEKRLGADKNPYQDGKERSFWFDGYRMAIDADQTGKDETQK
ncbi:hypothetical protein CCAX7_54100 [Capsulimonas corticalis]|uniref:Uncharacterized protein n=1 Tax=Capsulimonas corticalis TaxID=2219043 RepID=A0A402CNL0_9BACT|nr:hypothetical protein [Capsulimonas corticalis]BDI33359.1 hypothetical protein CCAX7_54100 [Capsulimonas corticalis]